MIPPIDNIPGTGIEPALPQNPTERANKVKKIALEILKGLGIVILGAAFGALTLASGGTVWIIVGVSLGAGVALASYVGTKVFIKQKRNRGFPAFSHRTHTPLGADKFTYEKFEKALNKIKTEEDDYNELKNQHPDYSEKKLRRFLWQKVRHHYSEGVAMALMDSSAEKADRKGGKLLKNISFTNVFYHQIREVIGGEELIAPTKDFALERRSLYRNLRNDVGMGTIRLEGKKHNETIFFEIRENGGVFYDGTSREAGMHDKYESKEQFLRSLDKHIRVALSGNKIFRKQFKSAHVNLY